MNCGRGRALRAGVGVKRASGEAGGGVGGGVGFPARLDARARFTGAPAAGRGLYSMRKRLPPTKTWGTSPMRRTSPMRAPTSRAAPPAAGDQR